MTTDDEARQAGFLSAEDMQHYVAVMREEEEIMRWQEAGAPSMLDMWRQIDGVKHIDTVPLTIEQAARRKNVKDKTIRRRLPALLAMDPRGAYRTGDGPRDPWRIIPAALDQVFEQTVEPKPAAPARGRRKATTPKKRSATRWEV